MPGVIYIQQSITPSHLMNLNDISDNVNIFHLKTYSHHPVVQDLIANFKAYYLESTP